MFKAKWRRDRFVIHVTDQHSEQFKTYSALTDEQKKVFMNHPASSPDFASKSNTISRNNADALYLHNSCTALNVFVDKSIVEGTFGNLLVGPDPLRIFDGGLSHNVEPSIRQGVGTIQQGNASV
jgi:sucrose-6-phosphate hydrolase SacC (GH32 family)